MSSRTSAFRGLALVALSALGFAACENKATPTPVIQPPATLSVTPAGPINLNIGQTAQLVASTANFAGTPTITYTSSVPAAATVSATGLVTAVAQGTSTITVKATGTDLNGVAQTLQAGVQVIVAGGTVVTPPITSISIQSITNSAGQNVDVTNVSGQINIAMNVDVPIGVKADSVVVFDGANKLCVQKLTSGSSVDAGISAEGAEAPVTVVCSVNTAALGPNGLPNLLNGSHTLTAGIYAANVRIASATDFAIVLNNNNYISAVVTTSRGSATGGTNPGPGGLAPAGSLWNAGDVVVTLSPVIYNGSANNLTSATVTLSTGGAGVNGVGTCVPTFDKASDKTIAAAQGGAGGATTPSCGVASASQTTTTVGTNGVMTVTFPEANSMTSTATGGNGVKGVEDVINITINSVTSAGQPGPVCINPNPSTNPQNPTVISGGIVTCGNGFTVTNPATGQLLTGNQLRLDNLGPRITNFDITPATLGCAPNTSCYINNPSAISTGFTSADYGVDSQTQTFTFGSAGTTALPASFGTADETATSGTDFAAVTVVDKLNNSSGLRFASRGAGTTVSSTTATNVGLGAQTFGIDVTAPTCAYVNTPAASVVTANELNPNPASESFALTFSDAATPPAGPSGFPTLPVSRTMIGTLPTGTTCIIGTGTSCTAKTSAGTAAPPGTAQFADLFNSSNGVQDNTERYVTYTPTVRDVAGNVCSPTNGGATIPGATTNQRIALRDVTAPATGGVVAPSTISGNQSVTFSATATDNIDLGAAVPSETYGAIIPKLVFPTVTLGTFGPDVFTTSAVVNFTDPSVVRSVETTNGVGQPTGVIQALSNVSLDVTDIAGNAAPTSSQNVVGNVIAGSPGGFPSFAASNPQMQSFQLTSSSATICNGDSAGGTQTVTCPTNPSSATLTAKAVGPASVFNNPFQRVNFYYTDGAGVTHLIGTGTVSVTDNTITSQRTWSYTVTWTPAALAAGAYNVFAVGVDSTGSGLQSNLVAETIALD